MEVLLNFFTGGNQLGKHLNTNKNILFQGCLSLLYVLMEFHPFIAHRIAPECGASNIRHKSTPNEAESMSGETL